MPQGGDCVSPLSHTPTEKTKSDIATTKQKEPKKALVGGKKKNQVKGLLGGKKPLRHDVRRKKSVALHLPTSLFYPRTEERRPGSGMTNCGGKGKKNGERQPEKRDQTLL